MGYRKGRLAGLDRLTTLQGLSLRGMSRASGVEEMGALLELVVLILEDVKKLTSIGPLRTLKKLQRLEIRGCRALTDVSTASPSSRA